MNYYTDWFAPIEDTFKISEGQPATLQRTADWTAIVDTPLYDTMSFTGHSLLVDNGNDNLI